MPRKPLDVRGLLIHVSHYDPVWVKLKAKEKRFDVEVALDVVDAMAETGMNLLIVDCADGVRYRSHPELKRPYSVPMRDLRKLADAAHASGIDVAPKLNFAKSGRNFHDMWMRPHWDPLSWLKDLDVYWKVAADLVAELVDVCRPKRFFHVGMDEDHYRSLDQYVDAIGTLRVIVRKHRLRTVIWNDSCHFRKRSIAQVHADKCRAAEDLLEKDIVEVLWDYAGARPGIVRRIVGKGFDVWAGPGSTPGKVKAWRRAVVSEGGSGLLLTAWIKCDRANRKRLLDLVRTCGPELA